MLGAGEVYGCPFSYYGISALKTTLRKKLNERDVEDVIQAKKTNGYSVRSYSQRHILWELIHLTFIRPLAKLTSWNFTLEQWISIGLESIRMLTSELPKGTRKTKRAATTKQAQKQVELSWISLTWKVRAAVSWRSRTIRRTVRSARKLIWIIFN